jgi:hypothetical protein
MNPAIAIEAVEKLGRNKNFQFAMISMFLFCVGDYFKAKEQ